MFLVVDPNEYEGFRRTVRRLIALNTIKTEKETLKMLVEEDKDRVDQKFKDADTSIPTRILSLYRFMIKASRDGTTKCDLGIPTVGEKLSLSRRTKDYLKDQEILLDKISPRVLLEKNFSKEDERKIVADISEAFLKFPELPMLESESVVINTLVQGVREGSLGLLINERIRYMETVFTSDISADAIVVRKEIAQKMKHEVEKGPIIIEPPEILGGKPPVEKEIIKRVSLRADVPWDKLSELVRGVFTPLSREGAQIALEVKIEARSEQGISKDTLDLKIKETLKQIGASVLEETED